MSADRYIWKPQSEPRPSRQQCPLCRAAGVGGTTCRNPELHDGQLALGGRDAGIDEPETRRTT